MRKGQYILKMWYTAYKVGKLLKKHVNEIIPVNPKPQTNKK